MVGSDVAPARGSALTAAWARGGGQGAGQLAQARWQGGRGLGRPPRSAQPSGPSVRGRGAAAGPQIARMRVPAPAPPRLSAARGRWLGGRPAALWRNLA
jgi:hypothetical protein